jgi:hypothetical protein
MPHRPRLARRLAVLSLALCAAAVAAPPAAAGDDDVIVSTTFESRTFEGWQRSTLTPFDAGWFIYSGTLSPISGFRIPAPPQGRFAAVVDQNGPGSNILHRVVRVTDDDLELGLTLWYRNRAFVWFTPRTLAFDGPPNQQLRIDIMKPSAPLRSMRAADILATVFQTRAGDPFSFGPRRIEFDLENFEDRSVRIRIAEVDNQNFFQVGVDAIRIAEDDDDGDNGDRLPTGAGASSTAAVTANQPYRR